MLDARFVPIDKWPGQPTRGRRASPFNSPYNKTLDLLEAELGHLNAREIVIEAFFSRDQMRNDGWPYSNANPSQPGVILSFKRRGQALSFPCDTFQDFQSNIRGIALSLQALRAVDRYGVTRQSEQYAGWKQIEAPKDPNSFASKEAAAEFMAESSTYAKADILNSADVRKYAHRECAKTLHPDRNGGNTDQFNRLNDAMRLLGS